MKGGIWLSNSVSIQRLCTRERGLRVFGGKGRVAYDRLVEGQRRRHALDDQLVQRPARTLDGLGAVGADDDDLRQQGVELAADDPARLDAGVGAHAGAERRGEAGDRAGRGQEAAAGVLAVDAELDRVAARRGVVEVELLAVGDAELPAHQVDAGDLFGDRVLDLQAGVDLEEGDQAVLADQELARCPPRRSRLPCRCALLAS